MTDFLHPPPSSSKGPPQWRPLFKRASTTPHQPPVVTPKTKSEELTMALQRPWLKFDMARKPSDQSQNDYVPEIFVACKLVPSYDDFLKESSAELELILKKRPTVSPKIKINVGTTNKETITLYNTKGEAHTTTVQSGTTLANLEQLNNDKPAETQTGSCTTATRKFTNIRSKRKVRNVARILANSKRRFNDLSKNLKMLYRRHKIKDCFVFMYKVPYKESFSFTTPISYKVTTLAENQSSSERLNEEAKENRTFKLELDICPSKNRTDDNRTPELKNGSGTTTEDFQQTSKQPEENGNVIQADENINQGSSNSQSMGNLGPRENLSMPELDFDCGSPCKEANSTRKSPPRKNSLSPASCNSPMLVDVESSASAKIGSHVEPTSHTVDLLINQKNKESLSPSNIEDGRSLSPDKLLSSATIHIFRKSKDNETTRLDKDSPSPKRIEECSVQSSRSERNDENRSPNSREVSITKKNIVDSDIKSSSPEYSAATKSHCTSKEMKQLADKQFPYNDKIKTNHILRRHSLGDEDRIRRGSPSPNFQQSSAKRVRSKSKEDRRHSTEKYRIRTAIDQTMRNELNRDHTRKNPKSPTENCTAKNCDKPNLGSERLAFSTDVPVVIKQEPKDDMDSVEPPTKKPRRDDETYIWWMARRVKKENVKSKIDLKTVNFKIYSCFRCHKEFSEHKHWAKHTCVLENS